MNAKSEDIPRKRYVTELDIVRFTAALMVMLFHFSGFTYPEPNAKNLANGFIAFPFMPEWTRAGWVGVQVFFVISGYVISRSVQKGTAFDFLRARAIRIVPALWFMTAISAIVLLAWGVPTAEVLIRFCKSVVLSPIGPHIDGVVWTLVVEAIFYGIFFAALIFNPAVNRIVMVGEIGSILLIVSGIFTVIHFGVYYTGLRNFIDILGRYFWSLLLLKHGIFFSIGIALSLIEMGRATTRTYCELVMAAVLALISLFIKSRTNMESAWVQDNWITACAIFVVMAAWIVSGIFGPVGIGKLLPEPVRKMMGEISYTMYLGHYTLGGYMVCILGLWFGMEPNGMTFAFLLFGLICFAILVTVCIERPVRAYFFRRRVFGSADRQSVSV